MLTGPKFFNLGPFPADNVSEILNSCPKELRRLAHWNMHGNMTVATPLSNRPRLGQHGQNLPPAGLEE